ncbi:MAG: hypothetical protein ACRC6T_10790 [Sarcina sp.]
MGEEDYNRIINYAKNTLRKELLEKTTKFKYKYLDGYQVIEVYIRGKIEVEEMGEILVTIEDYAKEIGFGVFVDFLRAK